MYKDQKALRRERRKHEDAEKRTAAIRRNAARKAREASYKAIGETPPVRKSGSSRKPWFRLWTILLCTLLYSCEYPGSQNSNRRVLSLHDSTVTVQSIDRKLRTFDVYAGGLGKYMVLDTIDSDVAFTYFMLENRLKEKGMHVADVVLLLEDIFQEGHTLQDSLPVGYNGSGEGVIWK